MRLTRTGNVRITRATPVQPASEGREAAHRDTRANPQNPHGHGLPVPVDAPPPRAPVHRANMRASAPFLAQLIAHARPGLSSARQARRNPLAALDAYRTVQALKASAIVPKGQHCDLPQV